MIGAGAVVTRDVPPHALVVGAPGRRIGWACRCGETLRASHHEYRCARCGDEYAELDGLLEPVPSDPTARDPEDARALGPCGSGA